MLKRIRELREEYGISQKALAEKVGVSQQSINKYENHNIEPDVDTLIRIASIFNTTVDYIIGNSAERQLGITIPNGLSDDEVKLLYDYRRLDKEEQYSIQLIIQNYNKRIATPE